MVEFRRVIQSKPWKGDDIQDRLNADPNDRIFDNDSIQIPGAMAIQLLKFWSNGVNECYFSLMAVLQADRGAINQRWHSTIAVYLSLSGFNCLY